MRAAAGIPGPLPPELLARLAAGPGLLLCLDYDGTLAEITADRDNARPFAGAQRELRRLLSRDEITIAIVTGRTIAEVKRLLGIDDGLIFSGVHGLEFDWGDGKASFVPEAFGPAPELATVREWLAGNVPQGSGFQVEDKGFAIGLHYRLAHVEEAQAVRARLEHFIASETRRLKVVHLKM